MITMIKKVILLLCLPTLLVCLTGCSKDIEAPSLPEAQNDEIAQGVAIDADVIFGIWEGKSVQQGSTLSNTFEQKYRLEFQSVDDAEVLYSHWYADARTNDVDSIMEVSYDYQYVNLGADITPNTKGTSNMKAVYIGNNQMELYSIEGDRVSHLCTLLRVSDPEPVVTGVNRTMPQAGEQVAISGRNLQFVDHVYLPTASGEVEVTDFTTTSKQILFTLPEGTYAPGAIRCQSTGAHISSYTPAYMFRTDCVFFKTFSSAGGTKPRYAGTEFESSFDISSTTLLNNNTVVSAADIPAGHSLEGADVINPETFLSCIAATPVAWPIDPNSNSGTKDCYIRFSTGDSFQRVLDNCNGALTDETACSDAAIQMDIYVYSDGKPEWTTGYVSWRLNKNNSVGNMVANVAMWSNGNAVSFEDGWLTFTIPLSSFAETQSNESYKTLGKLVNSLKNNKLESIIKLMNYDLDDTHTAKALESFQFNLANIRLVPYKTPANKKE